MNNKYTTLNEAIGGNGLVNVVSDSAKTAGLIAISAFALHMLLKALVPSKPRDAYIDQDSTDLIRSITNDGRVTVYVDPSKDPTAYADSSMKIFYTPALVNSLKLTERELTAILLHEYSHTVRKDFYRSVAVLYPSTFATMTIMKSIFSQSHWLLQVLAVVLGTAATKVLLDVTQGKQQEYKADQMMVKYGYAKEGMSAFRKMYAATRRELCTKYGVSESSSHCKNLVINHFRFDEHPDYEKRIAKLANSPIGKQLKKIVKLKLKFLG